MPMVINANMFRGMEAVGGKLYFEERYMVFSPHLLNFQVAEETIQYADIADVAPCKTLGVVPNGMLVRMKNGAEYKFVLNKPNETIGFLRGKIAVKIV